MIELKKDLEELSRQLNGRKSKIVKPIISDTKEMINQILENNN